MRKNIVGKRVLALLIASILLLSTMTVVVVTAAELEELLLTPGTAYETLDANGKVTVVGNNLNFTGAGGTATFKFTTTNSGLFKIVPKKMSKDWASSERFKFNLQVAVDDEEATTKEMIAYSSAYERTAGTFELDAGEHTLTVKISPLSTEDGAVLPKDIQLTQIRIREILPANLSASGVTELRAVDYIDATWPDDTMGTEVLDVSAVNDVNWINKGCMIAYPTGQADYKIKADSSVWCRMTVLSAMDSDADITIYLDGEKKVTAAAPSTKAAADALTAAGTPCSPVRYAAETAMPVFEVPEGEHTISITFGNVRYFYGIRFERVGGAMTVDKVAYGDTELSDGATIAKDTDAFAVHFDYSLDLTADMSGNVVLKNSANEEIKFGLDAADKIAMIKLKEVLAPNESYTLTIKDFAPRYGTAMAGEVTYTFTTDGTDSAVSSVECAEKIEDYEDMYIKLVVKSSVGEPIKGRKVSVTRTNPAGEDAVTLLENILSSENGVVEINDTITGTNYGAYTYTVTCEGAETLLVPMKYITREKESEILDGLAHTTAETITSFFDNNADELGINPAADIPEGVNADKVYAYFIGDEIASGQNFRDKFYTAVFVETINQAIDTDTVKAVLANESALKLLGLDEIRLGVLSGYVTNVGTDADDPSDDVYALDELADEIFAFDSIEDLDLMKETITDAIDNKLMEICGKSEIALKTKSFSVYSGKSIELPFELAETATNVTGIEISVWSDDMEFVKDKTTVDVSSATSEWDGDVLKIYVSYNKKKDLTDIGSVFLKPDTDSGSYTVKAEGKISYDLNLDKNDSFNLEEDIPVIGGIAEGSFSVTITKNTTNPKQNNGGVTTITAKPSTVPDAESSADPETPADTEKDGYTFSDIEGVDWAKESINALLKKGVISKSEDGKFNPNNNVTRAEYLKMVMEVFGMVNEEAATSFGDVSADDWFYKYAASAQASGIVNGNNLGEFRPNDSITREDMAVIVIRAMEKAGIEIPVLADEKFADDANISDYAKTAIYSLKGMGIINGVGDNMFMPLGNATRAETAKMVYEMIKVVTK